MATNPRSITDVERPLVDHLTVEQQADLIERVRRLGYPDRTALGLAGWLALKAGGGQDHTSSATRAMYRRILREVSEAAARLGSTVGYLNFAGQAA